MVLESSDKVRPGPSVSPQTDQMVFVLLQQPKAPLKPLQEAHLKRLTYS